MARIENGQLIIGLAPKRKATTHRHKWYVNYGITICSCGTVHPDDRTKVTV